MVGDFIICWLLELELGIFVVILVGLLLFWDFLYKCDENCIESCIN